MLKISAHMTIVFLTFLFNIMKKTYVRNCILSKFDTLMFEISGIDRDGCKVRGLAEARDTIGVYLYSDIVIRV